MASKNHLGTKLGTFCAASAPIWVAGLASALVPGCDRSDESEQRHQCERFCDRLEKCDDRTDLLDCRRHCESDQVRSLAYFQARADCAEEQSCNQWASEVDSQGDEVCTGDCSLKECVESELLDETLSEEDEHSCKVIGSMLRACDPSLEAAATAHECERVFPMLSEDYREDSETCVISECTEIEPCLSDLAQRRGTDLKVFSGSINAR